MNAHGDVRITWNEMIGSLDRVGQFCRREDRGSHRLDHLDDLQGHLRHRNPLHPLGDRRVEQVLGSGRHRWKNRQGRTSGSAAAWCAVVGHGFGMRLSAALTAATSSGEIVGPA